jgi:hypothetical protein
MSRVVIWKRDIDAEVKKVYKCHTLPDIKGFHVQLELSGQILDALEKEKDHRTPALMVEDAQEACAATVAVLAKHLEALDKKCHGMAQAAVDKEVKNIKRIFEAEVVELGHTLEKVPKERWDKWTATKKEYKHYKWDCAGKITMGALGAAASGIALAAAVPTGGATLALGIVGGAKSALDLFKLGAKMWVEAETVQKKVVFSIKALEKIYGDTTKKSQKSHKGGAMEAGLSVLNALLPTELAPTLSVLSGDVELWHKKLAGIELVADKKAKLAMNLLKQSEQMGALLKKSKSKDAGKILDKLHGLEKAIDEALTLCTNEAARVREGRQLQESVSNKVLPALKSKQPLWTDIFDRALPTVVNLALAGAGGGLGLKEATKAIDYAQNILDIANSVMTETKEQVQAALS